MERPFVYNNQDVIEFIAGKMWHSNVVLCCIEKIGDSPQCDIAARIGLPLILSSAQVSGDAAAFDAFRHRADLAFPEAKWAALFTSEGVQKANVLAQLGKLRMMNPTDRIHAVAQGTDHDMMQLLKFGRVIGANGHGFGAGGGGATQQTQLAEWFNLSAYSIPETVAATRDVGLNCVGVCPNGRIVRRLNPNAVNQQVFIKTANDAHFNAWVARKVWQQ